MTDAEKREAAHQFINRWMGRGNEDEDGRSYWLEFLSNVMGMENPTERVNFEKKVIVNGNTKRIDVYIPETHVIICIFRKNCASVPEERSAIPLQTEQSSAG